jgi:hypothetical protein
MARKGQLDMLTRLMRQKFTVLFLTVGVLLAVAGTTMALVGDPSGTTSDPSGTTSPSPTITSDQADYPPGATVTLTGSNWQPGESVHINVNDDLGKTWNYDSNPDVQADANGDISHSFQLPDWFVATYKVTATGDVSGVATHTFTDAISTTTTLTRSATSSNPSDKGEDVTFTATVTCGSNCTFGDTLDLTNNANASNCNGGTVLKTVPASAFTSTSSKSQTVTFNYAFTSSGDKSLRACYRGGGSGNSAGASVSDPPLAHYVNGSTSTSINCFPNRIALNQQTKCTATVTDITDTSASVGGTRSTPTGTVSFTRTGNNSAGTFSPSSCTLSGSGDSAKCSVNYTPTSGSNHTINANYAGDTNHDTGSSGGFVLTIGTTAQATSLTVPNQSAQTGQTVTLSATLKNSSGNPVSNQPVSFELNGNSVGTVQITNGNGVATLSNVSLNGFAPDNYPINAIFGGSNAANLNGSTGQGTLTVTPSNTAPTKPGTPAASSNPNNGEFTLDWDGSTDDGKPNPPGAVTYKLQHKNSASGAQFTDVTGATNLNSNSYTFGPNSKETEGTWTYQVIATDSALSTTSDASSAIKVDRSGPNAPTLSFNTSANQSTKATVGSVDWYKDSALIDVASNGDKTLADGSAGSGVKAASLLPFSVTTNGTSTATRTVEDNVGNVSSLSAPLSVHVDANGPTSSFGSASTADGPYSAGTYATKDVTVTLNANDGESGVEKIVYSSNGGTSYQDYPSGGIVVSQDGTTTIDFHAVDKVGHVESADNHYTVKLDKTDPTVGTATAVKLDSSGNPAGNYLAGDWTNTNVKVSWDCTDATSGPVNASDSQTVSTEGAANSVTPSCTDQAGNSATGPAFSPIKIDKTADITSKAKTASPYSNSSPITIGYDVQLNSDISGLKKVELYVKGPGQSNYSKVNDDKTNLSDSFDYAVSQDGTYSFYTLAEDNAGNRENPDPTKPDVVVTVTHDTVAPTLTVGHTADGNNGWNKTSPVTLNVSASDNAGGSGLNGDPTCTVDSNPLTLTAGNAGEWTASFSGDGTHSISCSVSDKAGNPSGTKSDTVNIDTKAVPSLASANRYSNSSPITVNYNTTNAATDTSGLKKVELWVKGPNDTDFTHSTDYENTTDANGSFSYPVTQDGDYRFYTIAEDNAGNREVQPPSADAIVTVTHDTVVPTTTANAKNADNSNYLNDTWTNQNVTVSLSATDSGSGVKEITYSASGAQTIAQATQQGNSVTLPVINTEGTTTVTYKATDSANNPETAKTFTVKIDKTAPVITDLLATTQPNTALWYKTDVTNRFKASDSGSGLSAACKTSFPLNAGDNVQSKTTTGEGTDRKVTSDSCTDVAGNNTAGIDSATFNVDKSRPTVSVTGVANDATYTLGAVPTPGCDTQDQPLLSDVKTPASVSVTSGTLLGIGTYTATCSGAVDNADNTQLAPVSVTYKVTTNWSGFSSPVDNLPTLNTAKAGQAIPLKWRITNSSGNPITNLTSVTVTTSSRNCTSGVSGTDAIEEYAAGSSGLQNQGNGYYQFNWKSPTNYANSCKTINLDMGEGVMRQAAFQFTK